MMATHPFLLVILIHDVFTDIPMHTFMVFCSSNLSFSELKKQHQVLSKDVEDLTQTIQENEEKHQREISEWHDRMSASEVHFH